MSQDLSPGVEAEGIPSTVVKRVSERHGGVSILVYEHWSPVLKEQRRQLHSPIPDHSDPSATSSGCHDLGHTWIPVLSHSDVCVSPETAAHQVEMLQDK